jgi:6-pyruvoyltetrahydropterin/6-carboxytetrahydropterin synthase
MPFEISTTRSFSAAHQLKMYDGSLEPLHGHNWQIRVTVGRGELDNIGVVMDFHELQRRVNAIVDPMHNANLNDLPAFRSINPSAENVALVVARALRIDAPMTLLSVEVWETNDCKATYKP